MLSSQEQREWQELAEELAGDPLLVELTARLGGSRPAADEVSGTDARSDSCWLCRVTCHRPRRRVRAWSIIAVLLAIGLGLAILGSARTAPVVGIGGLLTAVLTITMVMPLLLEDPHPRRHRRQ